jgi:hypothetical protein
MDSIRFAQDLKVTMQANGCRCRTIWRRWQISTKSSRTLPSPNSATKMRWK